MNLAFLIVGMSLLLSYALDAVTGLNQQPQRRSNYRQVHFGPRLREAHAQRVLAARREWQAQQQLPLEVAA